MATTTVVIAATTAADNSATFDIDAGASITYASENLQGGERIVFEREDGSGGFTEFHYYDPGGVYRRADLSPKLQAIVLVGPLRGRVSKPVTEQAVSLVSYT